jgi:xanthine dehydrogenase accessory factor
MNRGVLQALLATRKSMQPVVLLTPLDGSSQRVLDTKGLELLALTDAPLAQAARDALSSDRAQVVTSVVVSESTGAVEVLVTPQNPPLRLIIVGAVHIAEALCVMARTAGYAVTLIDPRSAFLRPDRFPQVQLIDQWPQQAFPVLRPDARTAVVLLTHDPKIDDPALLAVLTTDAFYIGALGSTRTHARRLERLAEAGVSEAERARIHGPAGLAIGARTPAEIALSVLAQMTQQLRGAAK